MLEAAGAGRTKISLARSGRARRRIDWRLVELLEPRQLMATDPILVVTGIGHTINFHDTSPSILDGTDFGTLAPGAASANDTFIISNGGAGTLTLGQVNPVTFTGPNAADFSVNSLTNNTDGTATLVVHYAPTAAGTSNAIVHIASNDPRHPDFNFALRGTDLFTDFNVTIGNMRVPVLPVISDGRVTLTVPVKVTNIGGLAVTGTNSFADVKIFLHDTTTGDDTLVTTLAHQKFSGLGFNGSKTFNVKTTLPLGFSAGTYSFVATVDADGAIPESNPLTGTPLINDSAASVATITVVQGHVDLLGTLVSKTIVPAVQTDTAFSGKLVVNVKNQGNIALPAGQKISLEVRAHNGTGDVVLATVSNISVANLKAGASRNLTLNIKDLNGLPAGTYDLEAFITPTPALAEDDAGNNLISQTASGQSFTLISGAPFVNLTGVLGKSTVPLARAPDTLIKGNLQVIVTNSGNEKLSSTQEVRLEIFANGIPLGVTPLLSVANLAPGASKILTAAINVPAGLLAGNYVLRAQIDTVPTAGESDTSDNLISLNAAGDNIPLTIA